MIDVQEARRDDRVPVDRRFAGFERRTIAPSLAVLALAALMTLVLPAIDDALEYDLHVDVGETIEVGTVGFVAPSGWAKVDAPVLAPGIERAEVAEGTTHVRLTVTSFDGTAAELLQVASDVDEELPGIRGFHVTGDPSSYTTTEGVTGVIERFTGSSSEGFVAAFVSDGVGVVVVVSAEEHQLREHTAEVNDLLDSVRFVEAAGPGGDEVQP